MDAGRSANGITYTWAGGNGGRSSDRSDYDAYVNVPWTLGVGALTPDGKQADFSESGSSILVTAPGVWVAGTDLKAGSDGSWNLDDDCVNGIDDGQDLGGTSFSTPVVSSVVALILEANAALTWRDVQHILVRSSVKVDGDDEAWKVNGAGRDIHDGHGFGLVDAGAATTLAASWTPIAQPATYDSAVITVDGGAIPDHSTTGLKVTHTVAGGPASIEHVVVVVNIDHPWRGDLHMRVVSPAGTVSKVAGARLADRGAGYNDWRFMSTRFWDEGSDGEWTLEVYDLSRFHSGVLADWRLVVNPTTSTEFVFTPQAGDNFGSLYGMIFALTFGVMFMVASCQGCLGCCLGGAYATGIFGHA